MRYREGACELVARRAIPSGAEITIDYQVNVTGGDAWPYRCGSERCRGVVVGEFFQLPVVLQREYAPFLADWFVRRHHERLAALGLVPRSGAAAPLHLS